MALTTSFDVLLLGLVDGSPASRAKYSNTMERLTGRSAEEFKVPAIRSAEPIFRGLDRDTALKVTAALGDVGVLIEVRRSADAPTNAREQVVATMNCPQCGFIVPANQPECSRCGLVFAKFEREQVQSMQKGQHLEDALTKALQSREEWAQKANNYLESHPLKAGSIDGFENLLSRDEVAFLRLASEEGPILMTSRRLIAIVREGVFSIPYEIVNDVTFGGGLVLKKSRVRLLLGFHAPVPTPGGSAKQFSWQLDKESAFLKEVLMDWCYSRNFMCGGCGKRDLDYRTEGSKLRARCMHCATDHDLDLKEAIAVPLAPPA